MVPQVGVVCGTPGGVGMGVSLWYWIHVVQYLMNSFCPTKATVSVTNPSFYGRRFLEFTSNMVFKKERGGH